MTGMAEVTVFAVGGTGESHPGDDRTHVAGLLSAVTAELDPRFEAQWIGYPASYGPVADGGSSFRRSTETGMESLLAALSRVSGPVMLIGYSQGCSVIRSALAELHGSNIIGVGLISDPQQPVGALEGCDGYGVAGVGPDVPPWIPARWIGDPQDMICNASDDSYIRDIADLTCWMSFTQTRVWVRNIWKLLHSNTFQNAQKTRFSPSQWRADLRRIRTAFLEVLGYLPNQLNLRNFQIHNRRGGRHVSYASEPFDDSGLTGCQVLAVWMTTEADKIERLARAA